MTTQPRRTPYLPQSYVLCERASGAVRFRVEADSDGTLPVEKVAGLLAVHCLVRGQAPEDFELMVSTREPLLPLVAERAQQLLAAGRAMGVGVKVSRREQEVLDGVLQSLANKEIAAKLNVSERTVKFHVSSLLAKFGVTDRVALSREASLSRMPVGHAFGPRPTQDLFGFQVRAPQNLPRGANESDASQASNDARSTRNGMFPIFGRQRYAT